MKEFYRDLKAYIKNPEFIREAIAREGYTYEDFLVYGSLKEMLNQAIADGTPEPKVKFRLNYKEKLIKFETEEFSFSLPYWWLANKFVRLTIYQVMKGEVPIGEIDFKLTAIGNSPYALITTIYLTEPKDEWIHSLEYQKLVQELVYLYTDKLKEEITFPLQVIYTLIGIVRNFQNLYKKYKDINDAKVDKHYTDRFLKAIGGKTPDEELNKLAKNLKRLMDRIGLKW